MISIMISLLLLALLFHNAGAQTTEQTVTAIHGPIRINNDTDLANIAVSGDGSAENPYVIENYEIDANGSGPAIYIGNTTAHFTVRNCTLYNTSGQTSLSYNLYLINAGLAIYNSTNVSVENVSVRDSYYGILMKFAGKDNLTVANSTISGCTYGIYNSYYPAKGAKVYGNSISGSIQAAIYSSGNMVLENNDVSSCSVGIDASSGDIVRNNTVHDSSTDGILCQYADSIRISGNHVFDNREYGIHLYMSRNCRIDNNSLSNDSIFFDTNGNTIDYLLSNSISDNTVNGKPIYLYVNETASVPSDAGEVISYNSSLTFDGISMSYADLAIHIIDSRLSITSSDFTNFSINVVLAEDSILNISDSHFQGNTADADIAATHGSFSVINTDFTGDRQAFKISNANPVSISRISMEDMRREAGSMDSCGNVSVDRLNMTDSSYPYASGIWVSSSQGTVISDSSFMNISDAIGMYSCPYSVVDNNYLGGAGTSGDGIYMAGGSGSEYTGGCHDSVLFNNTIKNYYEGIYTEETVNVTIHDNTVENCTTYGIHIFRASGFSIYHNNFIGSFSHAAYEWQSTGSNSWNLSYPEGGNYWGGGEDTHSGPAQNESGCDGIVDTPYDIYGSDSEDRYPLVKPTWEERDTDRTAPVAEFSWEYNGTSYSSKSTDSCDVSIDSSVSFNASASYDERDDGSAGNITNYTWTFQDGGKAYGIEANHTFSTGGNWTVTLEVTDCCGMRSTVSVLFRVNSESSGGSSGTNGSASDTEPPVITDNSPSSATTGDSYTFSADVTDNVQVSSVRVEYWYGTGSHTNRSMSNTGGNTWEYTMTIESDSTETLHYIISASDGEQWSNTGQKDVSVRDNDAPVADAGSDITITQGERAQFDASKSTDNIGIVNYTWAFTYDGNLVHLYGEKPSYTFDIAGNYTVTLTVRDNAGNTADDTVNVSVAGKSNDTEGNTTGGTGGSQTGENETGGNDTGGNDTGGSEEPIAPGESGGNTVLYGLLAVILIAAIVGALLMMRKKGSDTSVQDEESSTPDGTEDEIHEESEGEESDEADEELQ